jgi:hypothetical protein
LPLIPRASILDDEYQRSLGLIRFLTPLCKFYASEISNDVTRKGIQVHGGIGYMAESPAAHYHSDSIITTIYEGTSEIQASFALKEMSKGALFTTLERIRDEIEPLRAQCPELVGQVGEAINKWISQSAHRILLRNFFAFCKRVVLRPPRHTSWGRQPRVASPLPP